MVTSETESSLVSHFSVLEDPRDALRRRHNLLDMVIIAIAATLAGADGWVAIAQFGPRLLGLLMLKGAIVTIDAMGCQTKIAEQIIDQGGNDVLALKGNQGVLAAEVEEAFIEPDAKDYAGVESEALDTAERGRGRVETRRYRTLGDLSGVPRSALWKGMNRICMVEFTREIDGKVSRETRFFIGSIGTGVADFGRAVGCHWGVENDLHWSLDVAMREGDCRVRETQARENLAVLRHIAMSRLKNDSTKLGIKNKRLKAGWNEPYLAKLLFEAPRTAGQNAPSGPPNISCG